MEDILDVRSNETYNDVLKLLSKYHKCAVLRPTGFGKTVLMCRLALNPKYKSVLYVYPSKIVRNHAGTKLGIYKTEIQPDGTKKLVETKSPISEKVKFVSYSYLGRLRDRTSEFVKMLKETKIDLIIFDEIHHMGANLTKQTLQEILPKLKNIDIVGGTATPRRMDGFDEIGEFFDDKICSFYGLNDAIEDGIMEKPYYVYAISGYATMVNDELKKLKDSGMTEEALKKFKIKIRDNLKEIQKLTNGGQIIRETFNKVYKELPSYMRFMVFFPTKQSIELRKQEVMKWFDDNFKEYSVRVLTIHSDSDESKNVDKMDNLGSPDKTIDLIFSINMMNEGYHVDNITGVVLLRPTQSGTVYTQQVGRCMQVNSDTIPFIFDFVDNMSVNSIYDLTIKPSGIRPDKDLKVNFSKEEQMDNLNSIAGYNVNIVNIVAATKQVLAKIEQNIPTSIESKVLAARMGKIAYPASVLASMYKIKVWEVYKILDKYYDVLKPLNRQKQEADMYKNGIMHGNLARKIEAGE